MHFCQESLLSKQVKFGKKLIIRTPIFALNILAFASKCKVLVSKCFSAKKTSNKTRILKNNWKSVNYNLGKTVFLVNIFASKRIKLSYDTCFIMQILSILEIVI